MENDIKWRRDANGVPDHSPRLRAKRGYLGSSARYLVLTTPSGFEPFVIEAGTPAQSLTLPTPSAPDMEKLIAGAARHQIEVVGPLPD